MDCASARGGLSATGIPSDTLTLRQYAGFAGFDRPPLAAIVAIASGGVEA
jgi:hypothetical protein